MVVTDGEAKGWAADALSSPAAGSQLTIPGPFDAEPMGMGVPEYVAVFPASAAGIVLTTIVIAFEEAVAGEAHVSVEVITQLTMSPFTNPEFVYVEELVPVLEPFSSH